jgi:hypothetical protein
MVAARTLHAFDASDERSIWKSFIEISPISILGMALPITHSVTWVTAKCGLRLYFGFEEWR